MTSIRAKRQNASRLERFSWSPYDSPGPSSHCLARGDQRGNIDADHGAFAGTALDVQVKIRAIQHMQALTHVAQPDAFDIDVGHLFFGDAYAIVFDLDVQASVAGGGA